MSGTERPIVAYVPDLLMRQQVVEGLRAAGIPARGAATEARFQAALAEEDASAILVELDGVGVDGVALVTRLAGNPRTAEVPVIGLCAHTRVDLIADARAAGATKVISRGELHRRLPEVAARVLGATR
jgi:PleD family two-component response regulator